MIVGFAVVWADNGAGPGAQISEWPACGGANGSIRFEPEINHGANAGLSKGEPPPLLTRTQPHPFYARAITSTTARM